MQTMTSVQVGRNVRAEMVRQGVSQVDLGQRVGMTQGQVSKRLRGVVPFDVNELAEVAAVLAVPLSAFYDKPEGDPQ